MKTDLRWMKAISPESSNATLVAKNQNLLEEVERLKLQLEEAERELKQYKIRVEKMSEKMVDYRELWMNARRENELLMREIPSDADYPCYSQVRPEEGSSPYHHR
jgi:predicted  nucleic acid-binding Zn-ribbon protein